MSTNPDSVNFNRLLHLIVDVGTKVLRKLFLKKIQPKTLHSFLSQQQVDTDITLLVRRKVINRTQKELLNAFLIDEFDICLLVTLLTNVCPDVIGPRLGWKADPPDDDPSLGADLLRLRHIRNTFIGHCPRAQLGSVEFERLWSIVEAVLKRMMNGHEFAAECEEEIRHTKEIPNVVGRDALLTMLRVWKDQEQFMEDTNRRLENLERITNPDVTRIGLHQPGLQIEASSRGQGQVQGSPDMDVLAQSNPDILSSCELKYVAEKIGSLWDIATELEFDDIQYRSLEQNHPRQRIRQTLLLLTEWQHVLYRCDERPRYILAGALCKMDNRLLAEHLVAKGAVIDGSCGVKKATRHLVKKISFDTQPVPVLQTQPQQVFNNCTVTINNAGGNNSIQLGTSQPKQPVSVGAEMKKSIDDNMNQFLVSALNQHMESVGALVYYRGHGTVFRVGSKYVMTAKHVVTDIIDPGKTGQGDYNLLKGNGVYVSFSASLHMPVPFKIKEIVYQNEALDVAILEIENYQTDTFPRNMVLCKCTLSEAVTEISFIGFGHLGDKMKNLDPRCRIKYPNDVLPAINFLNTYSNFYKELVRQNPNFHPNRVSSVDKLCSDLDNPDKLLWSCFMEDGGSGSPGISHIDPNSLKVVTVYTHAIPDFLFYLKSSDKEAYPPDKRFERGPRMSSIYRDLLEKNEPLANELFPGDC